MKREFKESQEIEDIANEVIRKEGLDLTPAEVKYLMVDPMISKRIYGRCIRCSSELKHYSRTDYIIEISKEHWQSLDQKRKYLLVFHELKHIKVVYNEKLDEFQMKLQQHDLQDFKIIVQSHGVDWLSMNATLKKTDSINDDSIASE